MKDDTILKFSDPAGISPDPLTDVLRKGARELLAQAVEAEVCDLMAKRAHLTDTADRRLCHDLCTKTTQALAQAKIGGRAQQFLADQRVGGDDG